MQTKTITLGSCQVVATRNDESSKWNARLYVDNGGTATLVCGKFKTEAGLARWADRVLPRDR